MTSPDHFAFPAAVQLAEDADVAQWLDALAAQACTADDFMAEILRREHDEPDVGWETLALLDQQFRRHRISREEFDALKARLYQHFVGSGEAARHKAITPTSAPAPAPIVALRAHPLTDIPIIMTAVEAATPGELVEIPLHSEIRVSDKLVNRFRVVDILRRNAAGTLVEAIDELNLELAGVRKRVAIQMVDETLSREPEFMQRVGKLQCLSHPAIARVFDVEADAGALLLIMELLNGPSLHDLLSRSGGPLHASVTPALRAIAGALVYAHSQGVFHGDVSAANVAVTQNGDFRLQGFETQDMRHPEDAAADRLAFARLAHHVLCGKDALNTQTGRPHLRAPPGVSREQWRALRHALSARGKQHSNVLIAFAADAPVTSCRRLGIGTALAAILGIAGFLYVNASPEYPDAPAAITATGPSVAVSVAPMPAAPAPSDPVASPMKQIIAPAPEPAVSTAPSRPLIDLPLGPSVVETTAPVARVWVRRRGNLEGPVTFKWWTENGSAEADRDFRRVAPRAQIIPAGAKGVEVLVPLMPDPERREARTFWVKIDEAGRGATLGSRTLMQVAIVPPGYPAQR